jgi:polysaccharide pyruvyl transferase WcaK-like protein
LVRRTLGLAQHATCRDRRSSRVVGQLRGREAPVVPDLALSYPVKPASGPGPASLTGQLRVGIAPMAFGDSKSWPEDRVEQFRNYIDSLTETARRLMQSGASVTLFSTTPSDARVARAVFESLRGMPTASDESNVALTTPDTVDSLLQVLQSVDLVIASRLHAVILATDCARPLVAIACEWKVERFMLEMGLKPYCRRFAEVNADDLSRSVNTLDANRESIAVQMREFRKQALTSIESQYETLAAALEGDSSRRNG